MPVTRYVNAVEVVHRPVPDGVELPPLPAQADRWVGHYQRVLLNVRTGELSFFCADWRVHAPIRDKGGDRAVWTSQYPGGGSDSSVHSATEPIPELLMFFIDTWTRADVPATARPATPVWTFMTREQGDAFVVALVPLAQQLVDTLFRVPGTDDLEWSAESMAAVRAIDAACSRHHQGPQGVAVSRAGMVNFADVVAAAPGLVRPEWAAMADADLDHVADGLSRSAVYGARSWLYAYRACENRSGAGERCSHM
ncbi:hypothetical protein ACQPXB_20265 [Amycolatopsis sp. CA-161197]|uniref:hypothetical protein n=1 Tax=Amycolatopsis sp. CA-161197 TaxID=3239922 RepID=UPI003D93AC5D